MNVIEAIYGRRAVKHFDPEHRLSKDEERTLFEAVIQAPTSFNIQHWRFVVLRDPELRSKIRSELGNDQAQMTDASLLVLFTADMKAWQKEPQRYWKNAPQEVADMLVAWMGPFHEGRIIRIDDLLPVVFDVSRESMRTWHICKRKAGKFVDCELADPLDSVNG